MEHREDPMFGRKVFFLNPPLSVENYVVDSLKEREYEVYVIREYQCAKAILRKNINAICFIFIDDVLPINEWFNFIKSFEYDESLKSIFLGVISLKIKPTMQQKFLMNLKLPGGCVLLDSKVEDIFGTLEGILQINGAKGIRKYVRLDCDSERFEHLKMEGYLNNNGMLFSFNVLNISSAGLCCATPAHLSYLFPKLKIISDVSITVGKRSVVCHALVYDLKIVKDKCISVLLFTNETSKAVKNHIRNFIYDQLEDAMKIEIAGVIKDLDSYSDKEFEIRLREILGDQFCYIPLDKITVDGAAPADNGNEAPAEEGAEDAEPVEEVEEVEEAENVAEEVAEAAEEVAEAAEEKPAQEESTPEE